MVSLKCVNLMGYFLFYFSTEWQDRTSIPSFCSKMYMGLIANPSVLHFIVNVYLLLTAIPASDWNVKPSGLFFL